MRVHSRAMRIGCFVLAGLLASCGPATQYGSGNQTPSGGPCAIVTGGVQVTGGQFNYTADTLSCTGTVNGTAEDCGTENTASVSHMACSDGHVYTVTSGSATLYIHIAGGADAATWSAGAEFK